MIEDEDINIVDVESGLFGGAEPVPQASTSSATLPDSQPKSMAEQARHSARLRNASQAAASAAAEATERVSTRSSAKPKVAPPKFKFKLSEKAAAQAPGMSFLGQYDRELDSDDEELAFEEQFILRLPPGEDCDRLRKMVAAREVSNDIWFKFKDSRRAIFHIGNSTYSSKLVDLPCIIESQKTLDNKQMFKVADICQMLVAENRIEGDELTAGQRNFNIDEFIWPHGITPPLHHVRKRRFRKRINRRTIESVEQEVERLLDEDAMAADVKYEVLENVNPDLSDSEFIEREESMEATTPAAMNDDVGTPGPADGEDEDEEDEDAEQEGEIDEELAAELDMALGDEDQEADEEDDEDENDSSDDEDEIDEDDDEDVQAIKLLNEEIRDLEAAVAKKGKEIASSANPLIRKRFEDALKKLSADLQMKVAQRDEAREKQRMIREGIEAAPDSDLESEATGVLLDENMNPIEGDPVPGIDVPLL